MYQNLSADAYFKLIEVNHKAFLDAHLATQLASQHAEHKQPVIDQYLRYIAHYHQDQMRFLNASIASPTFAERAGRGAFSALLGFGIGAGTFAAEQHFHSADLLGIKTTAQTGFSALIGASCTALIYAAWEKSREKPLHLDYQAFRHAMQHAGFTDAKYLEIAENVLKLFHFRECLLLNLKDQHHVGMRNGFKTRYYAESLATEFNDEDFNTAIEVYFLDSMSSLFDQSFQTIYQIHQAELTTEHSSFVHWLRKHFETQRNREQFSQQMQIQLINECIRFLEQKLAEPGFLGKYVFLMDSLAGLLTGAMVLAVFAVFNTFLPLVGLLCIGLVATSLAATTTHLVITKTDRLFFARDASNRAAILESIERINKEQQRLTTLIQQVVPTSQKTLDDLKQFEHDANPSIMRWFTHEHIAFGSVRSWVREFASRYRDNKIVRLDLSTRLKHIIQAAYRETEALQRTLLDWATDPSEQTPPARLTEWIKATRAYLKNPRHTTFITQFELIQKIKEQVLELVGHLPYSPNATRTLPTPLIHWYIQPLEQGGLGGVFSDLTEAMQLCRIVTTTDEADQTHPYHALLTTAFQLNLQLTALPNANDVFGGDAAYRSYLGLPHTPEQPLTLTTLKTRLEASFDFLCTLNQYEHHVAWDQPFNNQNQFIVYRMLLMKQLADWANPNNQHVDTLIKQEINQFVRNKLHFNPDAVFDDVLNQALLKGCHIDARTLNDPLGNPHSIAELASISDALRVDIAHQVERLSPQRLITLEAIQYTQREGNQPLLRVHSNPLIPEFSSAFIEQIQTTLTATDAFLNAIQSRQVLQQTNAFSVYVQVIHQEIDRINTAINALQQHAQAHSTDLSPVTEALAQFKITWPATNQSPPLTTTPDEEQAPVMLETHDSLETAPLCTPPLCTPTGTHRYFCCFTGCPAQTADHAEHESTLTCSAT